MSKRVYLALAAACAVLASGPALADMEAAKNATVHGLEKAQEFVVNGVKKGASGVEYGAEKASEGVERAAKWAGLPPKSDKPRWKNPDQ